MEQHAHPAHRIDHIDQLRGIAVVGMVIAHAAFFFHNGANTFFVGIERTLNATVLTLFVFIAGLAASRHIDSSTHIPSHRLIRPMFKKIAALYAAYLVIALVQIISQAFTLTPQELATKIIPAITLTAPPNFTEYMPLFILITAISIPLLKVYRVIKKSLSLTIATGIGIYMLGFTLYSIDVPTSLIGIKALFVGHESLLRFPLLFYLPIYLLGLWWQHSVDHAHEHMQYKKISIITATGCIMVLGMIISASYNTEFFDPLTRWPPSLPFLATGLLVGMCIYMLLPLLHKFSRVKSVAQYLGQDALDILVHHLVILFLYKQFIGTQSGDVLYITTLTVATFIITVLLSSLSFSNHISFPIYIHTQGHLKFRKRYIIIAFLVGLVFAWNMLLPQTVSRYGNVLKQSVAHIQLPKTTGVFLSTNRTWYARNTPKTAQIELSVQAVDSSTNKALFVNPDSVTIYDGESIISAPSKVQENGIIVYSINTKQMPIGTHTLHAKIRSGTNIPLQSNHAVIHVTEPLLVAWTFDWEGWSPKSEALSAIENLGQKYLPIQFTHFIHPRMFLPNVSTAQQIDVMQKFLKTRETKGDEIALHLHMQFDFVTASGVTPRGTKPWGLRTNEGYDIPTTEYTPEEFRTILEYAKSQLSQAGFPEPRGFRAGGWFINAKQLEVVKEVGFSYDSSGRDKPNTGAFVTTPWNLAQGAQPYFLDTTDQNIITAQTGLLEIPNNALTTYESSTTELLKSAKSIYTQTTLTDPKTLIYVSHPQFYDREFTKISPVLDYLQSISIENDSGPVVFSTMVNISTLWTSLFY